MTLSDTEGHFYTRIRTRTHRQSYRHANTCRQQQHTAVAACITNNRDGFCNCMTFTFDLWVNACRTTTIEYMHTKFGVHGSSRFIFRAWTNRRDWTPYLSWRLYSRRGWRWDLVDDFSCVCHCFELHLLIWRCLFDDWKCIQPVEISSSYCHAFYREPRTAWSTSEKIETDSAPISQHATC